MIDNEGRCPDLPSLTVRFREEHLVGNVVCKWDIKALEPLQVHESNVSHLSHICDQRVC